MTDITTRILDLMDTGKTTARAIYRTLQVEGWPETNQGFECWVGGLKDLGFHYDPDTDQVSL